MEYRNRMKTRLLLLFCVLTAACLLFGSVSAAITAEATGACTNATYEGIEYFVPYTANSERSDDWRTNLTVKVKDRPAGNAAGEVIAMEVVMVNGTTRYQCTQVLTEEFSCNSLPKNGLISGIYLRYVPSVSEDTKINFKVYQTLNTDNVLLNANGVVKYPPYPCSRNFIPKDFVAAEGEKLVLNTSTDASCTTHSLSDGVEFFEQDPPFALVNIIPTDIVSSSRMNISVSPKVTYSYTLWLFFETNAGATTSIKYEYDEDKPDEPKITYSNFPVLTSELPLTLVRGELEKVDTKKKTLWGSKDFPTDTDFNIKVWYENLDGTLGYENSIFHFERNLNVQFAPLCTSAESKTPTGIATTLYDSCLKTAQPFFADLTEGSNTKGVEVTSKAGVTVATKEPKNGKSYWFSTRKCADSSCESITTTPAYVYSVTVADGNNMSKTYKHNEHATHKPGTSYGVTMKAWGTTAHPFTITGVRLSAEEPGTYVVYGFVTEKGTKKVVPADPDYAVKFYVVVPEKDQLDSCSTLANNGYFRAYWDDCADPDKTQLLKFEHIPDTEEAWIRNTSNHGVHFPYVPEWSYVPQKLEVASLTCRFEALSASGQPAKGYCKPNDVYVPPYTKVTITGGTLYLNSVPKSDEYRIAYARVETYNISHLFFSLYVKECEQVKKIPDTGISLRSPLKVSEKINAKPEEATSYVFTGNSLRIPAIGLGMETPIPIVHVYYKEGAENLEWDLSTLGNYVGELEGGSYLPYAGNSALTGHYYSMGVFKNLENLNMEDEIIVFGNDGIKYTYHVVQKFIAQPEDVYEMFQQVGERSLTLVTCENYNLVTDTYERRTLIRATIVGMEPYEVNW